MKALWKFTIPISLALWLCGCVGPLSGAASMQVTVDVYEGPLSRSFETQIAELDTIAEKVGCAGTKDMLTNFHKSGDSINLKAALQILLTCGNGYILNALRDDADNLSRNSAVVANGSSNPDCKLQNYGTKEVIFCGEAGHQIAARADALLKIIEGENPRLLPLSVYLNDATPSAFTESCLQNERKCRDEAGLLQPGDPRLTEVNRLHAVLNDQYWNQVNKVHANGVGDTRMAFVKDDIGNWSLKSFSSDASELLKAYNTFALKAIATATQVATGKLSPAKVDTSKSARLLKLGDRMAFGSAEMADDAASQRYVISAKRPTENALGAISNSWRMQMDGLATESDAAAIELAAICNRALSSMNAPIGHQPTDNQCDSDPAAMRRDIEVNLTNLHADQLRHRGLLESKAQIQRDLSNELKTAESEYETNCGADTKPDHCAVLERRVDDARIRLDKAEGDLQQARRDFDAAATAHSSSQEIFASYQSALARQDYLKQKKSALFEDARRQMEAEFSRYAELLASLQAAVADSAAASQDDD